MSLAFRKAFREAAVGGASKGWLDDTSGRGLPSAPRSDVRSCLLPDHLPVRMAFEVEEAFMLAGVSIGIAFGGCPVVLTARGQNILVRLLTTSVVLERAVFVWSQCC